MSRDPAVAALTRRALRPGHPASPVLLHVPHAARALPGDVRRGLLLDDEALGRELDRMTDTGTDLIAACAGRRAARAPWRWVNPWSRLVVDPERLPGDAEPMTAVGMGAVYLATSQRGRLRDPDAAREEDLLARFAAPYAEAVADVVADRLSRCGTAVVLDVHSYPRERLPYERDVDGPRPPVCLGTDPDHTPAWLVGAAADAFTAVGLTVGLDHPFAGSYTPLRHWRREPRVVSLMVEVRRDGYLDEHLQPHAGLDAVVRGLADLVDTVHDRPAPR